MRISLSMLLALLVTLLLAPLVVQSQTTLNDEWNMGGWDDEETSTSVYGGFVEIGAGLRLQSDPFINTDKTLSDIRAQFQWDKSLESSRIKISADLYYDGVLEQSKVQIRELAWHGNLSGLGDWGKQFDAKIGQQVLTWGTGDYVFLNDLFAKDFQSFFAGRDDDYLKAPSLSLKLSGYFEWANVDLVITPEFTPDNYINGDYFSFFSPMTQVNVAPGFAVSQALQAQSPEYALRIFKSIQSTEYAMYAYRGFHKSPSSFTILGEAYFSALNVYGVSVITPFAKGLLNFEMAYYDSIDDGNGAQALIPNSQSRWLAGYEQEIIKNLTASAQLYLEHTHDYMALLDNSINSQYEPNQNRVLFTQRLMYRVMQQTLTLNLFNFYSTSDKDGYLKLSSDYSPTDDWRISGGINVFYGNESYSFFSQFEDASNAFVRFKLYY